MTFPATEQRRVSVGIGQVVVTSDSFEVLVAYGLGSCVGVTAWDPVARVAGMAHVLLPAAPPGRQRDLREPARFADSGVDALVEEMEGRGAAKSRLIVKIAGAASVLGASNAEKFKIGTRNAEAIKERLRLHGLRLSAEDLGGEKGRTLEVHPANGRTYVRTAASAASEL